MPTNLDGVRTYHLQFSMGTIQGLFLPSLVQIGLVVAEEDFLMMFCLYMYKKPYSCNQQKFIKILN